MTLLKDLIDIPERVHKGDFVLRLSEGVRDPKATLRDYVVTEQLASCFDRALGLIQASLGSGSSKAAYLHGSFGSGKSHFMAVLYLLLQHDASARSIPELAAVLGRHAGWLEGRKFLLVPYHMIGAQSVESEILGHYAEHVRRLRPEAPVPAIFLADRIFENAQSLRRQMGDAAFFQALNEGQRTGGWGGLAARWDVASYEAAVQAAPKDPARAQLVSSLVETVLTAYQSVATGTGEGFVPIDEGLSHLSRHAKSLGYDGVILFLDELILWLASHSADMPFLEREAQKLAKLVEAQTGDRPAPIVSFVARQRDLRELVGEHVPGADRLAFSDVLKYWEGRFDVIELKNENLPTIVEKRILRPRDESARIRIEEAFRKTASVREEVRAALLGSRGTTDLFRKVYPFSPALIDALVAVSSVLQRERTALKLLSQILVDQRGTLQLGDVVPVGDLFDVLAEGDEPFSEDMRQHFENARKVYREKLVPLLQAEHSLTFEDAARLPAEDLRAKALRADDRIAKTLVLAALTPEVEAFKQMTGARLAALNHGTIQTPIPGQEARTVLQKCRKWAAQVGEVRIGEEANPAISLHVTGVDVEGILERAIGEDNPGNRRRLVRDMLFEELGVDLADQLFTKHTFVWRGTERELDILFGNVGNARELPDESLRAEGERWKMVLDFPFDPDNRGPRDDYARLEQFQAESEPTRTLCWLPASFGTEAQRDLGRLVRLEHILAGERFASYASHLSAVDRQAARVVLENQRSQLRERVRFHLEVCYGIVPGASSESGDAAERFVALDPSLRPRPPVGANLEAALRGLLDQMLAYQYPAHPVFFESATEQDTRIKLSDLRKVYEAVLLAIQEADGRILVQDRALRTLLRQIANPLKLGEMHETPFLLGHHWEQHFQQKAAGQRGEMTVGRLRGWMDEPRDMGLPRDVQALVILVFAAQTNRSFALHGGPFPASLDRDIPDDVVLVEQLLPSRAAWEETQKRAGALLGLTPGSSLLNAANVSGLAADISDKARSLLAASRRLGAVLDERSRALGLAPETASRAVTARVGLAVCEAVTARSRPAEVIEALAGVVVPMPLQTAGHSLTRCETVLRAIEETQWAILEAAFGLADSRAEAAASLRARVVDAIGKDELAIALAAVLKAAQDDAARLLADVPKPSGPPVGPTPPVTPTHGWRVVAEDSRTSLAAEEVPGVLEHLKREVKPGRRLSLSWRVEEKEDR